MIMRDRQRKRESDRQRERDRQTERDREKHKERELIIKITGNAVMHNLCYIMVKIVNFFMRSKERS
jgi:hypothetical protein